MKEINTDNKLQIKDAKHSQLAEGRTKKYRNKINENITKICK